ncbi:dihydrolipoamide dehydrogenase [Nakamurella sp. UYEF19]|uniref:dihydrolipoyl dehydrogenase family protein n=1 Tax=Nakamurella sp. UYEF19 TaxID=1756392 RepID=UPI00339507D5
MPDTDAVQQDTWDVVIIGGAPPGENVAQYATQGSDRTAVIVEKELVGGECSFWACMPSKALLRPISVLDNARNLPGVQSIVGDHSLDAAAVLKRRDEIVHHHDDTSQVDWATSVGIDVVRGHGRVAGAKTVEVTLPDGSVRTIHARLAVVLDTGTTAAVPPIPGLREALPWISRDVTNIHQIPRRAAVIGGGVVACEAASWLNGLGVDELTIIGSAPKLLARNEDFAGEHVVEKFRENGVTVHLNARVDAVHRADPQTTGEGNIHGGEVTVSFGDRSVTVDEVLVATGRVPASHDIGLESIGSLADAVAANHGYVKVDDHFTVEGVDGEWLYAIGDLNGRALLTHMGKYQARICGAIIAARAEGRSVDTPWTTDLADHGIVPQVTFTDPEVASVGPTEAEAREKGFDVKVVEYNLAWLAGTSLQRDNYKGNAKLVIDEATHTILGATFVGPDVSDLLHAATVAVVGKVPLEQLWHAVPSYPTVSEIWLRLLETYFNPS